MYTKVEIFNLALKFLLLQREIGNISSDKSNENSVLKSVYDPAFYNALIDMDLDATSTQDTLALVEKDPNDLWDYSYTYPSDCVFLRRLQTDRVQDNRYSHIGKRVAIKDGSKVIFTDEEDAIAEYVSNSVGLNTLSAPAGMAVAALLAWMSTPLIVGKGSRRLREDILAQYTMWKGQAQSHDRMENFNYETDNMSEFVEERLRF